MKRRLFWLLAILLALVVFTVFRAQIMGCPLMLHLRGLKTVDDRLRECGPRARMRWAPYFAKAGIAYPPAQLTLVGLKEEEVLQVYAAGKDGAFRFIRAYPVLAASGTLGPKLRQGDFQVPEGIYRIDGLNPNSAFHLSMHVDYPNAFDRAMARLDDRTRLGGDIMIHGSAVSAGCLAMGDEAAEDLFIMTADTGLQRVRVILAPWDFRTSVQRHGSVSTAIWIDNLYKQIKDELKPLPLTDDPADAYPKQPARRNL